METDKDDRIVEVLLFELATWHALAKLRLHTESTLIALESSGIRLGEALREFQETVCKGTVTTELPAEADARKRKQQKKGRKGGKKKKGGKKGKEPEVQDAEPQEPIEESGPREKEFNMETYKLHSLGDYPQSIRMFGTTDNTTTQTVCAICYLVEHAFYYL